MDARDPAWAGRHRVELDSISRNHTVNIQFEDVARKVESNISPRLIDFLEIASYVFTADCSAQRGEWTDAERREPWGRDMVFVIAVRDPEFWATPKIKSLMQETLLFLSNDSYSFHFVPLGVDRVHKTPYFDFDDQKNWPFYKPHRVLMFSGGLDSLAGIVETAASGGKAVLISHRPVSTLYARQRALFIELQKKFPGQLIHIPVWINKDEGFGREPTQRTRSFLFTALGTLVAQLIGAGGIRFYENGVLSVNLPMAEEVLRARASRTTHPLALHLLSSLAAAVTERELPIDNPFLFKTKTEVVQSLVANDTTDLIALTCSCSHLMFQSGERRHCGKCSQCIDRRFAVAGAGLLSKDPATDYVNDVFIGPRQKELERSVAIDYTRHGIELECRSEIEIAALFNAEISRAVRHETKKTETAQSLISMYKRHGTIVRQVLEDQLRRNATKLIDRTLERTSLLALVIGQNYLPGSEHYGTTVSNSESTEKTEPTNQSVILTKLNEILSICQAGAGIRQHRSNRARRASIPNKRDTVLFAAITSDLEGTSYCAYVDKHRISPKWSEDGPKSYRESYLAGGSYRKKVQDEKTRAKQRMKGHPDSVILDAFVTHLRSEFNQLSYLFNSRNSLNASKK